jgi:hypothetical protein
VYTHSKQALNVTVTGDQSGVEGDVDKLCRMPATTRPPKTLIDLYESTLIYAYEFDENAFQYATHPACVLPVAMFSWQMPKLCVLFVRFTFVQTAGNLDTFVTLYRAPNVSGRAACTLASECLLMCECCHRSPCTFHDFCAFPIPISLHMPAIAVRNRCDRLKSAPNKWHSSNHVYAN